MLRHIKQLHKAAAASILTSVIQGSNVRKQPGENLKPSLLDYADSAVKQTRFFFLQFAHLTAKMPTVG